MFVTGRDGRILSLNPVAQQLVGRHQDVVGARFRDVVGCLASAEASYRGCPLEQTLRTGEVTMVSPHQWIRADGTGIEIAATFWPRGRGPESVGAIVICRDLTVERETERSIQRVARLAEDAPNPIVEFDEDGVMLYANTAMVELLNYGTSIQGRVEAVLPPNLLEVLNDCLASQQPTVRLEHRVEDRILAWSFFPLGSSKQVRVYGTDITADVALRRAKEAAEESARAKAIFLATMSHELRTPMNGVLGCTQLLQDTSLTDQQRQLLETMYRSAESLLVLVNDILDFSKIEAGKMTLEVADVGSGKEERVEPSGTIGAGYSGCVARRSDSPPASPVQSGRECGQVYGARRGRCLSETDAMQSEEFRRHPAVLDGQGHRHRDFSRPAGATIRSLRSGRSIDSQAIWRDRARFDDLLPIS
jgi:PAS domain-containing protein